MTLGDLINRAKTLAASSAIPEADFFYVLEPLVSISRAQLTLNSDKKLSEVEIERALSDFNRLIAGEPPQYITGKAAFFGYELSVAPGVLIPRPETEGLVELALSRLKNDYRVLDIGTGSGAIAIALKSLCPSLCVEAIDICPKALEIAKKNASDCHTDITFYQGDMFPDNGNKYDAIISNPPYITATEMEQLGTRVKDHEPWKALFGGEDGLDCYRTILGRARQHLSPSGFIALEHGALQRDDIGILSRKMGYSRFEPYPDLQGRDRYLLVYP
jgi:release factor glutamine methyltransferase